MFLENEYFEEGQYEKVLLWWPYMLPTHPTVDKSAVVK